MSAFAKPLHKAWTRWKAMAVHGPSRCAICRQWPSEPLCDTCIAHFAAPRPRCQGCAMPLPDGVAQDRRCGQCLRQPSPLHRCIAAVDYGWPWREVIGRFKFQEQSGWATPLAWLLRGSPGAEDMLHEADGVLPIPLSKERLAERGYNQSWLLARQLAPDKAEPSLLLRIRHTPPQRTLPRAQRLANLRGALALDPLRVRQVRGQRLVLIDDVMTSGASLHTAAQVLLQAGAAQVSALVLARTGHDGDDGNPEDSGPQAS